MKKFNFYSLAQLVAGLAVTVIVSQAAFAGG
jgi:hypothetical protein